MFAPQPEIKAYLEHCAQKYGVLPHLRFDTEIRSARWSEDEGLWHITDADGVEHPDNTLRFARYAEAVARLVAVDPNFAVDIVHLHDWHAAAAAAWLRALQWRGRSVLTIHNLAFHGAFGRDGVKAFKDALAAVGSRARIVHEEYAPQQTTDFTAPAQRLFEALALLDRSALLRLLLGALRTCGGIGDLLALPLHGLALRSLLAHCPGKRHKAIRVVVRVLPYEGVVIGCGACLAERGLVPPLVGRLTFGEQLLHHAGLSDQGEDAIRIDRDVPRTGAGQCPCASGHRRRENIERSVDINGLRERTLTRVVVGRRIVLACAQQPGPALERP
jgi:hypothetical protein